MKPQYLKVSNDIDRSLSIRQDIVPFFYNQWHYHKEHELVYIEKGKGTQFVGDCIQNFKEGDLLLLGSNLPHYWRCDRIYFEGKKDLIAQATVIHFLEDSWGREFLNIPENKMIRNLLSKARYGIKFIGNVKKKVVKLMNRLVENRNCNPLLHVYKILDILSNSVEFEILSTTASSAMIIDEESDRINRIYAYSIANFQDKISIEDVADIANMSPHSFCRYFKKRTRKTYFQFLMEIRIGHACKLLIENKLSVSQICFESGFKTFSNFNKYFKLMKGKSPIQFQKEYLRPHSL